MSTIKKEIPDKWPWFELPGYGSIQLPSHPTYEEFLWAIIGSPAELNNNFWEQVDAYARSYPDTGIKKRRMKAQPGSNYYGTSQLKRIESYWMQRDTKPLRRPATMTFDNPFL